MITVAFRHMPALRAAAGAALLLTAAALFAAPAPAPAPAAANAATSAPAAFPGAVGTAAVTPGGRGGRILRVTTLAADGPGSLKAAIAAKGPRIIVFEVGGVIDMGRTQIDITEPYLTIAGQRLSPRPSSGGATPARRLRDKAKTGGAAAARPTGRPERSGGSQGPRTRPARRLRDKNKRRPGGDEGDRTPDLSSAIAALSHLSYVPVSRVEGPGHEKGGL